MSFPRSLTFRKLAAPAFNRAFHSSRRALIAVGDRIPSLDALQENSPGNKVNLANEAAKGKSLIIGVPAAFSKF
jgi:peroxiredoxin 5